MRFPVVLFDLDGTVIDSGAIILASMRHAAREVLGTEVPDEDLMAAVGGPGLEAQMHALAPDKVNELVVDAVAVAARRACQCIVAAHFAEEEIRGRQAIDRIAGADAHIAGNLRRSAVRHRAIAEDDETGRVADAGSGLGERCVAGRERRPQRHNDSSAPGPHRMLLLKEMTDRRKSLPQ